MIDWLEWNLRFAGSENWKTWSASAVIEGCLSSSADLLIVMDADLQHDEKMIPEIVARLSDDADIVVVSRDFQKRLQGLSPLRQRISRLANYLLQPLLSYKVMDPMSGFFGIRGTRFGELAPEVVTGRV
ncbi:MAG: glycosyltransferase [Burkholderiales bacterium]|nr:glycosyltransferase [Burkholderiales bacterium]